ncbi:predicted protein [Plenodomus lingam JN3]|uniref:Predicted protein n=1 Tax=Leptosphaeria maculans (strain JN3 / isolate v23.1.3 / race Av1-4-5-6-7-8) TaxID=985895 RepID=E4ZS49_LEPMJ|nr:predicted protein [Plenodomus lingam JN3]CBX94229.1 predicted protein [Plenodomus lingam JN3]
MSFIKRFLLRRVTAVAVATAASLVIYLFVLLGCIGKGAGIDTLQWVNIIQTAQNSKVTGEIKIGYFGFCTNLPSPENPTADRVFTCFPRGKPPSHSNIPIEHPLFITANSLQKNALYPIPALAAVFFLLPLLYYFIAERHGGRNEKAAKILLGVSVAVGIAGALTSMSAAQALHVSSVVSGGATVINSGRWMMIMLWVAASAPRFTTRATYGYTTQTTIRIFNWNLSKTASRSLQAPRELSAEILQPSSGAEAPMLPPLPGGPSGPGRTPGTPRHTTQGRSSKSLSFGEVGPAASAKKGSLPRA